MAGFIYMPLDLETGADPLAKRCMDAVKPDARLRDPDKIAASIAEKETDRDAEMSLHPDLCRIVALGYHVVGHAEPQCLLMRDDYEERAMLKQFWELYRTLNQRGEVRFVTFAGLSFDLPVLLSRSMYLLDGDYPAIDVDRYRSAHAPFDLWWHLSRRGAVKAKSLRFYRKRFGIDITDDSTGADIAQMLKDEDWNGIEAHCLADVATTHALANRLHLLKL